MPAIPARIDEVTLVVSDVGAAARFYADGLGFSRVSPEAENLPKIIRHFTRGNVTLTLISREALLGGMHIDDFGSPPCPITLAVTVPREDVDTHVSQAQA